MESLSNAAALPLILRDVRDSFAAARHGHLEPAMLDAKHAEFWKSLENKPVAEQLRVAKDHLQFLGGILCEREAERQAACAYIAEVRRVAASAEADRRARELFVARATGGIQAALQTLQFRLSGVAAELGSVTGPADLSRWWSDFESFIEGARGSVAVEIAAQGVPTATSDKLAA